MILVAEESEYDSGFRKRLQAFRNLLVIHAAKTKDLGEATKEIITNHRKRILAWGIPITLMFGAPYFILTKTDWLMQKPIICQEFPTKNKLHPGKLEVCVNGVTHAYRPSNGDAELDITFMRTHWERVQADVTFWIADEIANKTVDYSGEYNIQRIDGLAESKVTPPESVYKRIKKENNAIGEARAINSDLIYFKEKFIMPVEGIISGVYGSQRILNGKPRWPHYGIDIAAKQGTMIKSSGTGVVTMAEDDLYYTGGTIIMDHGHGISTIYSHLENVLVSVGDRINQGDIIGTVGSTGRSTGPHLDFRINWFQTRLDPMSVLK